MIISEFEDARKDLKFDTLIEEVSLIAKRYKLLGDFIGSNFKKVNGDINGITLEEIKTTLLQSQPLIEDHSKYLIKKLIEEYFNNKKGEK